MNKQSIEEIIKTVESELPTFADCVRQAIDLDKLIVMHQATFATDEVALLGKAIKYAGFHGVDVHIIINSK